MRLCPLGVFALVVACDSPAPAEKSGGDTAAASDTAVLDTGDTGDTGDSGDTDTGDTDTGDTATTPEDRDGDGSPATEDCDDTDPAVFPGADEVCNGGDDDCDSLVDDADDSLVGATWYADEDGDGWGDETDAVVACEAPSHRTPDAGDCDDDDDTVHPGADESDCTDPVDYNCDGSTGYDDFDADGLPACEDCDDADAGMTVETTWYADLDGDTFGDAGATTLACIAPAGTVANADDCADDDAAVNPAADEVCNDLDDDCDTLVDLDDDSLLSPGTWYLDLDGDGFGDPSTGEVACDAPPSSTADGTDCDDADDDVHPDADEVCNGVDDDCDLLVDDADDSVTDAAAWFSDADGDGYGDATTEVIACEAPAGAVDRGTDCDDADAAYHPDADESDCADPNDYNCDGSTGYADADGDGFAACEECDDGEATTFPGAEEVCDDADNDCDGEVDLDASDATAWYLDADDDGHGLATDAEWACDAPSGRVADDTDCDDADDDVSPSADEACNGIDDDCDTLVDDADAPVTGTTTWYADADGDTHGDEADPGVDRCTQPTDHVASADDCDDGERAVHPSATETCNAVDDDCDGFVDDADASVTGTTDWYDDLDGDGFGDPAALTNACDAPAFGVTDATDCDDSRAGVHPDATEVCDALDADEDCDGLADDVDASISDASTWYADADADGFGTTTSVVSCDQPAGYAELDGDCDDSDADFRPDADESDCTDPNDYNCDGSVGYADDDEDGWAACAECDDGDAAIFPGADERCDGADNDCDGTVDEDSAIDATSWYTDSDEDGFGDAATGIVQCDAPVGTVADASDCDDTESRIHPDAVEVCDAARADEDCDGLADDDDDSVTGTSDYFGDADGDGFGTGSAVAACTAPAASSTTDGDCDDANDAIHPDAAELCDAADIDEDCNGRADDDDAGASGGTPWYADTDGDGYGEGDAIEACDLPEGYVANDDDCDDGDADIHPGATEVCNGADDDCDGATDGHDASDETTWYDDDDGDGYGDAADSETACDRPAGFVADDSDCDDLDAAVFPGATEACNDLDDDCDGTTDTDASDRTTWYDDDDGDTYGDAADAALACDGPAGFVSDDSDCDDSDADVFPGAVEVCNDLDDDCDGDIDGDATDKATWYADTDGDAYGDAAVGKDACDQPADHVSDATDCDDDAAGVNPGATEVCDAASIDEDCDGKADDDDGSVTGRTRHHPDDDLDGYGDETDVGALWCDPPSGVVANDDDCDDGEIAVNPGETETCNGVDDDCDGTADGDDATGQSTWYADVDEDGYGDADNADDACDQPAGFVADDQDCDDAAAAVYPGAVEVCNGEDDDCDGGIDLDAADALTWYVDEDGDEYGDASGTEAACDQPDGYVADDEDCDDAAAGVHPGATEVCDAADTDEDCDARSDDDDASVSGRARYYPDDDADTFGDDADSGALWCDPPSGLVTDHDDCDDDAGSVNPDAVEVCNGLDDDCDGTVDGSGSADAQTFYADADDDGYGDSAVTTDDCEAGAGWVDDDADCDDSAADVHPGATESCNGEDDDCDDEIDESGATGELTWYADADADSYGDATVSADACDQPDGYVADDQDCDDGDDEIHPDAAEVCDTANADEDCDGLADDDDSSASGATAFYADADGDAYGDPSVSTTACDAPTDYVADAQDCDDGEEDVHPDAEEVCNNGVDEDCDEDPTDCEMSGVFAASTATYTFTGLAASDNLGTSVIGAGDVDGDGNNDLAMSAYGADRTASAANAGVTWIFLGPLDEAEGLATADATLSGTNSGDRLGFSSAAIDDMDADGFGELLVGADGSNASATDAGAAYVFDAAYTGALQPTSAVASILGITASDLTGTDVAGPGDVDGDDSPDLLVGAYARDANGAGSGTVALFYGPISGSYSFTADVVVNGAAASDAFGWAVDGAGDVDGDGSNEWIVGAYGNDPTTGTTAGAAYVFGALSAAGVHVTSEASATLTGAASGDEFGFSVAGADDVDGDGYGDVLVGAHKHNVGTRSDAGSAYLFLGSVTGLPTVSASLADATFDGVTASDFVGRNLDAGGDVNGDGFGDLLIGAAGWDAGVSAAGAMFLVYGPVGGTLSLGSFTSEGEADATFYGNAASDGLGGNVTSSNAAVQTLAIADDLDDDGYDEVVGGAQFVANGAATKAGAVYVWPGTGF